MHKPHVSLSDCSRCKNLDSSYYSDLLNNGPSLPAGLMELVGSTLGVGMYKNITTCPECGANYSNTNDCGFMENDIQVTRISPTEANENLDEEDVEAFKKDLSSSSKKTQEYAAECLAAYYNEKGDLRGIRELFQNPKREIRLRCVVFLLQFKKPDYIDLYKTIFDKDPDDQIRMNASRYFNYYDEAIEANLSFLVEKLKNSKDRSSAASVLETYLLDKFHERKAPVKNEIQKQSVDLSDPAFEFLLARLNR